MMARFDEVTRCLRNSLDSLAVGWQDLWHKARRFDPIHAVSGDAGLSTGTAYESMGRHVFRAERSGRDHRGASGSPCHGQCRFDFSVNGRYLNIRGKEARSITSKTARKAGTT
jgi:hypothetical protein